MPNNTLPEILTAPWIMGIETQPQPQQQPAPVQPEPAPPPAPEQPANVRPWAHAWMLASLALSVVWLAAIAYWMAATSTPVPPLLIGVGFALIVQLGVAIVADPVQDGPAPAPPCTPCRNTLTGRQP